MHILYATMLRSLHGLLAIQHAKRVWAHLDLSVLRRILRLKVPGCGLSWSVDSSLMVTSQKQSAGTFNSMLPLRNNCAESR